MRTMKNFVPGQIITATNRYGRAARQVFPTAQRALLEWQGQLPDEYKELDDLVLILEVYPKSTSAQLAALVRFISGDLVGWTWIWGSDVVVIHEGGKQIVTSVYGEPCDRRRLCRNLGCGQIISIVGFTDGTRGCSSRRGNGEPIERLTYTTWQEVIKDYGVNPSTYSCVLMDHVLILEAIHPEVHQYGSSAIIRIIANGDIRWTSAWPDDVILLHQEASKP